MDYIPVYFIIGLFFAIVANFRKQSTVVWILFWPLLLFWELFLKIGGSEEEPKEHK